MLFRRFGLSLGTLKLPIYLQPQLTIIRLPTPVNCRGWLRELIVVGS